LQAVEGIKTNFNDKFSCFDKIFTCLTETQTGGQRLVTL